MFGSPSIDRKCQLGLISNSCRKVFQVHYSISILSPHLSPPFNAHAAFQRTRPRPPGFPSPSDSRDSLPGQSDNWDSALATGAGLHQGRSQRHRQPCDGEGHRRATCGDGILDARARNPFAPVRKEEDWSVRQLSERWKNRQRTVQLLQSLNRPRQLIYTYDKSARGSSLYPLTYIASGLAGDMYGHALDGSP